MEKSKEFILLLSKLMNGKIEQESLQIKKYLELRNLIRTNLPEILDAGLYPANASVISSLDRLLDEYKLFSIFPELAEKNIVVVYGNSRHMGTQLFNGKGNCWRYLQYNTNLPMLILPKSKKGDKGIYAVTYADNCVGLLDKEYIQATRQLYKEDIEIRKLVKAFILYENNLDENIALAIIPEYTDFLNEAYQSIINNSSIRALFIDSEGKWEKLIKRLPRNMELQCIAPTQAQYSELIKRYSNPYVEEYVASEDFFSWLHALDNKSINGMIAEKINDILLDVLVYYKKQEKALNSRKMALTGEVISLSEEKIASRVKQYQTEIKKEKEEIVCCMNQWETACKEIVSAAEEYEKSLYDKFLEGPLEGTNVKKYQELLLKEWFKYIEINEYEKAEKRFIRLKRTGYKYMFALEAMQKAVRTQSANSLGRDEIEKIRAISEESWEIAKIKIALSNQLEYQEEELIRFSSQISRKTTAKEWFYSGKRWMKNRDFRQASIDFFKVLDSSAEEDGYIKEKAGEELINLHQMSPRLVDAQELAENLVPEANYCVGAAVLSDSYKKGMVNLKMAAANGHLKAIELIAQKQFEWCKKISWRDMGEDSNKYAVQNVIHLYSFLSSKTNNTEYGLKIGLMYCKLKDYSRAYKYLKDIEHPEAIYECAKMFQYGHGVAQNLEQAKTYYLKLKDSPFKDSQEQYEKICNQISREKKKANSYSASKDYSESYDTGSYSESCFITTAACMALNEKRDCKELNELRRFRDEHIVNDGKDGNELVKEYYRIAPEIIKKIDEEWNPLAIYTQLWENYILPSSSAIQLHNWDEAKNCYIDMVKMLCSRYNVAVSQEIIQRYGAEVREA